MERCLSVRVRAAKLLLAVVLMFAAEMSAAEEAVVLVVGNDSPIEEISLLDIRKAYLGITITMEGRTVRPLRQDEDDRLNLIFLQSVIAMSHKSYERRLLSMMLKYGTPRPVEVDDHEELVERLAGNRYAIGYMWKSEADANPRVKAIKVLWQES